MLLPGTAHAPDEVMDCSSRTSHRNEHLAGKQHPVTGVPFNQEGYPVFESVVNIKLPEELRGSDISDARQFAYASQQLKYALEDDPDLESIFTVDQVEAIKKGWPHIPGFTWHHHEDGRTLQLVERDTHTKTGHSGGRATTGGRPK